MIISATLLLTIIGWLWWTTRRDTQRFGAPDQLRLLPEGFGYGAASAPTVALTPWSPYIFVEIKRVRRHHYRIKIGDQSSGIFYQPAVTAFSLDIGAKAMRAIAERVEAYRNDASKNYTDSVCPKH